MVSDKVGDYLHYGLVNELLEGMDPDCFETVMVWFYLNGYLSAWAVREIKEWRETTYKVDGNLKILYDNVLAIIKRELKEKFEFTTTGELFDTLNSYSVPEWMLIDCNELYRCLPNIYMLNGDLYYIKYSDDVFRFERVAIEDVECFGFSVDDGFCNNLISHRYYNIIGCDRKRKVLYLRTLRCHDMYIEYYAELGQEKVCHNKCIGMIGDKLVIEDEGYLVIRNEEDTKRLKELDLFEEYYIDRNTIFVSPNVGQHVYFRPYRMDVDGNVMPVTYKEAVNFLILSIDDSVFASYLSSYGIMDFVYKKNPLKEWDEEVFSIANARKLFSKGEETERTSVAKVEIDDVLDEDKLPFDIPIADWEPKRVACCELIKILEKYFDESADVLDFFYFFADVSRRYEKCEIYEGFGRRVLYYIEDLDFEGKLSDYIYDLPKLRAFLYEKIGYDEVSHRSERNGPELDKIGGFDFVDGELRANSIYRKDGVYVGGFIMMRNCAHDGMVIYDLYEKSIVIKYTRFLSQQELVQLEEEFKLLSGTYQVFIEER